MRFLLTTVLLVCIGSLAAQNLTGIWRGKRSQVSGGCFPEYNIELHITYGNNNNILGNAYSYIDNKQYTKINFSGRYNPLNKRMVLIESAVLEYTVPANCLPCIKTYDLNFILNGTEESLSGEWKGHFMNSTDVCPPGKITLTRQTTPTFPVDIVQNDTLLALQKKLQLQPREKEVVQSIAVDTPVIKIELYDNAEIDDDTVTVLLNNTLLLYKQRLSYKPLTVNINVYPNADYELMMYADNLGRIPPNTALMIVTVGKKKYEVRLSSSEQKSAVVRFRYQK
ncbi:MAG: hypothetical protein QM731_07495 [Chitinophagaceae bacterium]